MGLNVLRDSNSDKNTSLGAVFVTVFLLFSSVIFSFEYSYADCGGDTTVQSCVEFNSVHISGDLKSNIGETIETSVNVTYQEKYLERFFDDEDLEVVEEMQRLSKINGDGTVVLFVPSVFYETQENQTLVSELITHWADRGIDLRVRFLEERDSPKRKMGVFKWLHHKFGEFGREIPRALSEAKQAPKMSTLLKSRNLKPKTNTLVSGVLTFGLAGAVAHMGYLGFPQISSDILSELPSFASGIANWASSTIQGNPQVMKMGAWYQAVLLAVQAYFWGGMAANFELWEEGYTMVEREENGERRYYQASFLGQTFRRMIVSALITTTISALSFSYGDIETTMQVMKYMGASMIGWGLYGAIRKHLHSGSEDLDLSGLQGKDLKWIRDLIRKKVKESRRVEEIYNRGTNIFLVAITLPLNFFVFQIPAGDTPQMRLAVMTLPSFMAISLWLGDKLSKEFRFVPNVFWEISRAIEMSLNVFTSIPRGMVLGIKKMFGKKIECQEALHVKPEVDPHVEEELEKIMKSLGLSENAA